MYHDGALDWDKHFESVQKDKVHQIVVCATTTFICQAKSEIIAGASLVRRRCLSICIP
jgi:hypothetical protein